MGLQKEDIGFVFNEPDFQRGDILLMDTYDSSQREEMSHSKYLHAAIYIGDAFLAEADSFGVVMNHIYSYAFKSKADATVLRLKADMYSDSIANKVVEFVFNKMGMAFGLREAYSVREKKNSSDRDDSNRSFCSRLVAQAYHFAGVDLVENPNFCEPDDFLNSELLDRLDKPLEKFDESMWNVVSFQQSQRSSMDSESVIQSLFWEMSLFYGCDIQTMDQFLSAALNNIDKDNEALKVLEKQPWFTPFDTLLRNERPWFYNDEQFFSHFPIVPDILFFIYNQFLHYDNTYLPLFKSNVDVLFTFQMLNPNSKVIERVASQFASVYKTSIEVRKRLAYLYDEVLKRYPREFGDFVSKYGFYKKYKDIDTVFNIDGIFNNLMKVWNYRESERK